MDFNQLGPYKIGKRLGKGGMGSVYRGENLETGDVAAIKALAPQLATSEGFRERFEAEIESLKTLRHDGIVRLYGYGEEASTLFYAMELVEGRSLEEELKAGRRFNWREVVDISIQVCRALKHAHDHGIVHRDIKPANILLDREEHVKLADFGIARLFGGSQLTMAGGVLGTADYMSPEQADGRPVTDRCDQYSLGCVMYALLAGRPPFQASNLPEMLQLQRYAAPEPVRRYAPRAPEQLENCISQLLKKDPDDRFPNVLVLSRHLEAMRRALSRPFDHSQPMPGDDPLAREDADHRDVTGVPLPLATTREASLDEENDAGDANASHIKEEASIDIDVVSTAVREAATIDSSVESLSAGPEQKQVGHFTTVDVQGAKTSSVLNPSVWIASAGLLALALAMGGMIYQVSRPYDADELYQLIHAGTREPSVDDLRSHTGDIDEFLARFSGDPRAAEMREYQDELELDRQKRRFAAMARGRGDDAGLLTAERLYLAALRQAETDPAAAAAELRHLLALFTIDTPDKSLTVKQQARLAACLELARRQLDALEPDIKKQTATDLATLDARLDVAQALHASDPDQAAAICRAIVELYGDKAWARGAVERARHLLESVSR